MSWKEEAKKAEKDLKTALSHLKEAKGMVYEVAYRDLQQIYDPLNLSPEFIEIMKEIEQECRDILDRLKEIREEIGIKRYILGKLLEEKKLSLSSTEIEEILVLAEDLGVPAREDCMLNFLAAYLVVIKRWKKSEADQKIAASSGGRRLWEKKLRTNVGIC